MNIFKPSNFFADVYDFFSGLFGGESNSKKRSKKV